jgi:hypothetical protein
MRKLFLVLAVLGGLFVQPSPAEANGPVVMVEVHVKGSQDANLRWAVHYVDRFTMSRMVFGKCVPQRRCIVVRTTNDLQRGTGWTSYKGSGRVRLVRANPARGDGYMRRLWAHEIGHAFGLKHSHYRTNLMWPTLFKKGNRTMVPIRFTDSQRAFLSRH